MNKLYRYCFWAILILLLFACTEEEIIPVGKVSLEINDEEYEVTHVNIRKFEDDYRKDGLSVNKYVVHGNIGSRYRVAIEFFGLESLEDGNCFEFLEVDKENEQWIRIHFEVQKSLLGPAYDAYASDGGREFSTTEGSGAITACHGKKTNGPEGTKVDASFSGVLIDQYETELEIKNGKIENMPYELVF